MLDLGPHFVGGEDPLLDEEARHRHLHELMTREGSVLEVGLGRVVVSGVRFVAAVVMAALVFLVVHFVSPGSGASQCS